MTESTWTAALLKKLRLALPSADVHKVNERIQGGRPDVQVIVKGNTIYLEFKGPKTPVTPLQRRTIDKMRRAGALVYVVRFTGQGTGHVIEDPPTDYNVLTLLEKWDKVLL